SLTKFTRSASAAFAKFLRVAATSTALSFFWGALLLLLINSAPSLFHSSANALHAASRSLRDASSLPINASGAGNVAACACNLCSSVIVRFLYNAIPYLPPIHKRPALPTTTTLATALPFFVER